MLISDSGLLNQFYALNLRLPVSTSYGIKTMVVPFSPLS